MKFRAGQNSIVFFSVIVLSCASARLCLAGPSSSGGGSFQTSIGSSAFPTPDEAKDVVHYSKVTLTNYIYNKQKLYNDGKLSNEDALAFNPLFEGRPYVDLGPQSAALMAHEFGEILGLDEEQAVRLQLRVLSDVRLMALTASSAGQQLNPVSPSDIRYQLVDQRSNRMLKDIDSLRKSLWTGQLKMNAFQFAPLSAPGKRDLQLPIEGFAVSGVEATSGATPSTSYQLFVLKTLDRNQAGEGFAINFPVASSGAVLNNAFLNYSFDQRANGKVSSTYNTEIELSNVTGSAAASSLHFAFDGSFFLNGYYYPTGNGDFKASRMPTLNYSTLVKKVTDLNLGADLPAIQSLKITKVSGTRVEVHFQSAVILTTQQMRDNFDPQYRKAHDKNPVVYYDAAYLVDELSSTWLGLGISASVPVIK
jgi:hypothetical protein